MQNVLFFTTLTASLLTTGLFMALVWEFVLWRRSHSELTASESIDRFMATSRTYGPMMAFLGAFLALRTLEEVTDGFTAWSAARELGTTLVPILLFFAAVVAGSLVWARRSAHLRQTGEPVADEREVAINLKANRLVVSVLVVYTLVRTLLDYVQGGESKPIILFIASNPWSQTLVFVVLIMGLAQSYYRRQMS